LHVALAIGAVALALVLVVFLYQLYQLYQNCQGAKLGDEMNGIQLHTPRK
jgi:hypothetical protein